MRRRLRLVLGFAFVVASFVVLMLIVPCGSVASPGYSFYVPEETVIVQINEDSSLDITYIVVFYNETGADPIDIVDIGMPTTNFNPSECQASINDHPLEPGKDIRGSEVLKDQLTGNYLGVEIELGEHSIMPGEEGTLWFHGRVPEMVFQDTAREGYASVEFKNTWWDPQYAKGETALIVSFLFPPGVQQNETLYHGYDEPSIDESEGRVLYTWLRTDASPSQGYTYGVSFPAVYVSGVYPKQPSPDYTPVYPSSSYSGYTSGGTNWWVYVAPIIFGVSGVFIRLMFSARAVGKRGGKVAYIAPSVGVEGAGPMTELTPAEASVLMGQHLDRVAAVAYMEMLQKGLVTLKSVEPFSLSKAKAADQSAPAYYLSLLGAIDMQGNLDRDSLKISLTNLIKDVERKVKGFSHEETVRHYEDASSKAWTEVKSTVDHRERMDKFNQRLPLLLLDSGFGSKVREAFGAGDFPVPAWALGISRAAGKGAEMAATSAGALMVPGEQFAESMSVGFRSVQDAVFPHIKEINKDIIKEVNPMEYRRIYTPILFGSRSSYGRSGGFGGGGGCACACACAGCACACAGGGR